jgi:hypothetical protein
MQARTVSPSPRKFIDVETAKAAGRTAFGEMIAYLKKDEFRSRREWGRMGGRPKGSGKQQPKKGGK